MDQKRVGHFGYLVIFVERLAVINPANTKHLYDICTKLEQRRRRLADVVHMLYKCFLFAGNRPLISYKTGKQESLNQC